MAVLNWVYGAKPDIESELCIDDAIYAAHKYRNELCALELTKRERHEALLQRLAPDYVAACDAVTEAESSLAEVREAIQAERVKQRTKRPKGISHLTQRATKIKKELKELRATRKTEKQESYEDPIVKEAMDENAALHKAERSQAKQESGLYWGTEGIVRQACASFSSGAPPRFKRYDGTGQLAVQLQGGLDCEDATRQNFLCYFDEIVGKRAVCYIRVASDGRNPVFARVPIVMHRPLPKGGKIKWGYLEKRKIANHVRWSIRLNVEMESPTEPRDPATWVAIHYGWRMQPNGLRVALWQGSDGKKGAIVLPMEHCKDYEKLDALQSEMKTRFNESVDDLRSWIKSKRDDQLPEFLREISNLHAWKSHGRLASLVLKWRDERFSGDETIFEKLNSDRKWIKHRWQNACRLSRRIVRRRKDSPDFGYRAFAKKMSDQYGVVFACKFDLKELTENSEPEDLERDNTHANRRSKWAAIATLHQMICEKFPLGVVEVDSQNLTRECSRCGEIAPRNQRKVQCRECGKTWDCDENALANTIARGKAALKSGALLDLVAAQREAEKKRREKLAKMQEANRAARKKKQKSRELQEAGE